MAEMIRLSKEIKEALDKHRMSDEQSYLDLMKVALLIPPKEIKRPKPKGQPGRKSEFGFEKLAVGQHKTIEVDDSQDFKHRFRILASVRNMSRNGRKYVLSWPRFNVAHVLRVS